MKRSVIAVLAISLAVGFAAPARVAEAERWTYYDNEGLFCEGNMTYETVGGEPKLAKVVCRNPQRFAQYKVCFFDLDRRVDTVFMDCFASKPQPGLFDIQQQQMTFAQFSRLGR